MKTKRKPARRHFQLKLLDYGSYYYAERVQKLESILAQKPRVLELEMIDTGEISADTALLIRSVLRGRSPATRLVTRARSSLRGSSLLLWLEGNERHIREDARVFLRRPNWPEDEFAEKPKAQSPRTFKYQDPDGEIDPDEGDYAHVLKLINEYLPVNELLNRLVGLPVLRQFGLVDNNHWDQFLVNAFAGDAKPLEQSKRQRPKEKRCRGKPGSRSLAKTKPLKNKTKKAARQNQ